MNEVNGRYGDDNLLGAGIVSAAAGTLLHTLHMGIALRTSGSKN